MSYELWSDDPFLGSLSALLTIPVQAQYLAVGNRIWHGGVLHVLVAIDTSVPGLYQLTFDLDTGTEYLACTGDTWFVKELLS